MSSFNARFFALITVLLTAACGFTPVYGPGGTATALQNAILVDAPQDRNAYWLTQRIEQRLGRAAAPRFGLSVKTVTVEQGIAVDPQGDIARYNILGRAEYTLTDIATGDVVTSGIEDNFTGYSATGTSVATLAAERDARERLMITLADQIVNRLITTIDANT
jgi:LPS-assembly lipoprotein